LSLRPKRRIFSRNNPPFALEDHRDRLEQHLALVLPQIPSLREIVIWGGYIGLFAIIFAETGLLIGFFLPGDSLLVTAGLYAAATGELDPAILIAVLSVAAVSGDATGYWIGLRAGHSLYARPQSRFFRRDHLIKTREFYEKYGGITIVVARFMPFARTFAPVVAGIGEMRYRRFALFNIFGGVGWVVSMTLLGFYLGTAIPGIEEKIEYVIGIVVLISILPMLVKYAHHRLTSKARHS
jgi:membrane-associated protein